MKHPKTQPFSPKSKPITREQRLQRNLIVSLIFTPIVAIGVILGERLFRGAFAVDDFGLRVFALVTAFAWILVIIFAWRWIAQAVDRWILGREMPASKKRPKAVEYNWQFDTFTDILRYRKYYEGRLGVNLIISLSLFSCSIPFILLLAYFDIFNESTHPLIFLSPFMAFFVICVAIPLSLVKEKITKDCILNPKTRALLSDHRDQIIEGKYGLLHQRLEQAKAIYIDWETMFITAELYIYTGEIERGLELVEQLLTPLIYLSFRSSGDFEALRQNLMLKTLTLKLDGLILQHNYHEANEIVEKLLQFESYLSFVYINSLFAKLYLFQGDSEQAAKYLLKLGRITEDLPRWLFAYNRVLWAWCSAYQRNSTLVDKFILSALENSDPKFKSYHSCIYLFAGFARRELGQPDLMRLMFKEAFRVDPEGVYGKMARRELETLQSLTKSKRDVPLKAKSSLN
jgi:hypothetical protein